MMTVANQRSVPLCAAGDHSRICAALVGCSRATASHNAENCIEGARRANGGSRIDQSRSEQRFMCEGGSWLGGRDSNSEQGLFLTW